MAGYRLGSMGTPKKVDVNGTVVFICCNGCRQPLLEDPEKYLAKLTADAASGEMQENAPQMDLPPIGVPEMIEPQSGLPPIEAPEAIMEPAIEDQHAAGHGEPSRGAAQGGRPMIRKILDFCIRERLLVLLASVALIAYGWYSTQKVPLDAIPNVGENQVIVLTEWMGRSPKDVEDQITYPLSIALQAVPGSKSVRGKSMFGFSFVQVTFDDGVDFYWARSRVAEQLTTVSGSLPEGVTPTLAPDATALGQIYYYVLEPPAGMDLAELRSKQDFFIKYSLQSVDGVAEVASIGGYVRQYQIEVDPDKLRYHNIPLSKVIDAVKASNIDVGAKTVEIERHGVHRSRQGIHRIGQDGTGDDRADRKHGRADPRRSARSACATWPRSRPVRPFAAGPWTSTARKRSAAWSSCGTAKTRAT